MTSNSSNIQFKLDTIVTNAGANHRSTNHIKEAAKIANAYLSIEPILDYLLHWFSIDKAWLAERISHVTVGFFTGLDGSGVGETDKEITWAYTIGTPSDISNSKININSVLDARMRDLNYEGPLYRILVWYESVCLLHELGHLIMCWKGVDDTRAGYQVENSIFGADIFLMYIIKEKDDPIVGKKKETQFTGVARRRQDKLTEIQPDFIYRVYNFVILRDNISIHIEQLETKTEEPNWPSGIKAKGLGNGEQYDILYDAVVFPNGSKITACKKAKDRNLPFNIEMKK